MVVLSIWVRGLVLFWLVIFGVELWMGLNNLGLLLFKLVEGNMLILLVNMVVMLERILLNKLFVIMVLNCLGFCINCMVVLFIYKWDSFILG